MPCGEQLIRIRSAGICASDFTYIAYGMTKILGHELAGVTEDGTPVGIETMYGCEKCPQCVAGRYNLCVQGPSALGVFIDGGMSEYFAAPARAVVPLPAALAPEDACLIEPAAVAWHACRIGGVGRDIRVAIVGGGAIGLLAAAAAQSMRAAEVSLVARHPHQHDIAERFGVTRPSADYDVVIDAAGAERALHDGIALARPGGTFVVLGVYDPDLRWPQHECFVKELRVVPSLGFCAYDQTSDYRQAVEMLATRPELVAALITHRFPLEDAAEAFRVARDKSTGAVRVIVEP